MEELRFQKWSLKVLQQIHLHHLFIWHYIIQSGGQKSCIGIIIMLINNNYGRNINPFTGMSGISRQQQICQQNKS